MALKEQNFGAYRQLSRQIHSMSKLNELLTLKIIHLEERLSHLEETNTSKIINLEES